MTVVLISKSTFSSGSFPGIKNIAYNPTTQIYTLTKSDDSTVTYSSVTYYLMILWN